MVKSQLLVIIAIISGFLLTLQLITLQIIVRQSEPAANPIWKILYAVTTTASGNDINLFLVDPTILPFVANGTTSYPDTYCKILCHERKVTHLATLSQYATQARIEKFTDTLRERGYTVIELRDFDQNNVHYGMHLMITLHLLVFNEASSREDGHVVHIIVFHDKMDKHWWSGGLDMSENQLRLVHRQGVRGFEFKMMHHDSIYAKVELRPHIVDGLVLALPTDKSSFLGSQDLHHYIECNLSRSQEFYATHHQTEQEVEESTIFRTKVKNLMVKVIYLLDKLRVPFWLSSGTCLGYYRQCDVIPYSLDVDIGIWIKDYNPKIIDLFSTNDLPLLHVFGKPEDSFELSFRDGDLKLDVFFFYEDKDHVWNGGTQARTGLKFKYTFPKFTLCWTNFLSLKVRVPCQTQSYIEANYGKNWLEPVKTWDWKASPPNVKPNGQWPVEEWPKVIQLLPVPEWS
ncbi:Fukutin [Halotydeus destructor]|nr:Fukutin [Halotydeus destructor]